MDDCCLTPFHTFEINSNGDVYTCCPAYINNNKIGNIWESNSPFDIWYSEKANEIRTKVLNGDYSLCNLDLCRERKLGQINNIKPDLPLYVKFAYDTSCNLCCLTCRDKKIINDKETERQLNEKIDTILLPLLQNAKIVALDGSGEAFFSQHSRLLIKKIAETLPEIQFDINTNGILFNENNCKVLGILNNRINEVFVSLPALDETLYNKIMRGSNIDVVLENIKWMAKVQKEGKIGKITINSVIHNLNYREIPKLITFAKKLDIHITLSQFCYWGTEFGKEYSEVAVWEKGHKNYKDFVKVLRQSGCDYEKCYLQPLFKDIADKRSLWDRVIATFVKRMAS